MNNVISPKDLEYYDSHGNFIFDHNYNRNHAILRRNTFIIEQVQPLEQRLKAIYYQLTSLSSVKEQDSTNIASLTAIMMHEFLHPDNQEHKKALEALFELGQDVKYCLVEETQRFFNCERNMAIYTLADFLGINQDNYLQAAKPSKKLQTFVRY